MKEDKLILFIFFILFSIRGIAQNNALPGISESDFVADFKSNLAVSERELRKVPAVSFVLDIRFHIDEKGSVYKSEVRNDIYGLSKIVEKSLNNLPVFEVSGTGAPYHYDVKFEYLNPYFGDDILLDPRYPGKGGIKKLHDEFAEDINAHLRIENIGDFTLVYFIEEDGTVKDFVYEEPVSKALKNYTRRFFRKINKFEPAYLHGLPVRHKMIFTFSIIDN